MINAYNGQTCSVKGLGLFLHQAQRRPTIPLFTLWEHPLPAMSLCLMPPSRGRWSTRAVRAGADASADQPIPMHRMQSSAWEAEEQDGRTGRGPSFALHLQVPVSWHRCWLASKLKCRIILLTVNPTSSRSNKKWSVTADGHKILSLLLMAHLFQVWTLVELDVCVCVCVSLLVFSYFQFRDVVLLSSFFIMPLNHSS